MNSQKSRTLAVCLLAGWLMGGESAWAGAERTFEVDSLIIPMDLSYQDNGLFQAYGLLFQLLRHDVQVQWVIAPDKAWHHAPCNEPGDECAWDCRDEGSGVKCDYPTASPDFSVAAQVVWDDTGQATRGDPVPRHPYRGGPFVIAAEHTPAALEIIDIWNDQATWPDPENEWARRTEFSVVTVHQTTEEFTGYVRKQMMAAPTIAVFSDGNENIATSYLRSAGIPQSDGSEFPKGKCGADDCGPGTDNPDMLTVPSVMGDMGTCDARNLDHKNGALFTDDGLPAYCQIMSMHWGVNDREDVQCEGGCGDGPEDCTGQAITYHGHEVVAEVRKFLMYPVHFFAECQAVNAYENTSPNPAWPWADDLGRNGHFLTTTGQPPACPDGQCSDGDFECIQAGCDNGATDCCLAKSDKELGAGFLIADQPDRADLKILHPDIPYNQMDGAFETVGGSEPAYNLSDYLQTAYKNGREVTFVTGANGPGDQDIWMTGFVDGECDIHSDDTGPPLPGECNSGKVSYLGGHSYGTALPLSQNPSSQGTRLFLNALFEADCVTSLGQPELLLTIDGSAIVPAHTFPVTARITSRFTNRGRGAALDASLQLQIPQGVAVVDLQPNGQTLADGASWDLGSISGEPALAGDPASAGTRWADLSFDAFGEYSLVLNLSYRVGASQMATGPVEVTIRVASDSDGDGIIDDLDPFPDDANACGDSDGDTCDDCSVAGHSDPANDGPDRDGDGLCDDGDPIDDRSDGGPDDDGKASGCGCGHQAPAGSWFFLFALFALLIRRR
jgi:uncharacterized protein (TIGR03382 family)